MKEFIKWVLAVLCGLAVWGIIKVFMLLMMIGSFAGMSAAGTSASTLPKEGVLVIDLATLSISEQTVGNDIFSSLQNTGASRVGIRDASKALKKAAEDPGIKYVLLKTDNPASGICKIEEFRKSLIEFRKSGKAIVAYGEQFSSGSYYLASVADRIYTTSHHGGSNFFVGISGRMIFLKDLLDKLGINYQLIRHGKYKSAGETYVKNAPSPENMLQNQEMIDSMWETIAEETAEVRGLSVDSLNYFIDKLSINFPQDLVDHKLADETFTVEEYKAKLAVLAGKDNYKEVSFIQFPEYVAAKVKAEPVAKNKIAIIYADGDIVEGEDPQNICGDTFAGIIAKVRADSTVKGVVLRVNSPGGTVLAASKIKEEIDLTRAVKPVVASYGDYAASGGYWISNSCDHIFANRTTLTGSIGVFSAIPEFSGTLKDVAHINITAVNSHRHSDMLSLTRPFDKEETAWLQASVDNIYETFINEVAQGRDKTAESVDSIAQGRVWTGSEALKIGLVDEIGTLEDALAYTAGLAGNPDLSSWGVVTYPKPLTPLEMILNQLGGKTTDEETIGVFKGTPLEPAAKDVLRWARTEGNEPVVFARMPYWISVR
ncbi:MAG: signal peptide peptidase SppA [Candidatus Cryptobacteroides sp.]